MTVRPFGWVIPLLALAGCAADANAPMQDFELSCQGVALHLNGFSSSLTDASSLPTQRYVVSVARNTVSKVLADGRLDNLCMRGAKCDLTIDEGVVRISSRASDTESDFLVNRRSGWAYHLLKITLKPNERDVNLWQMSCSERSPTNGPAKH